MTPGTVKIITSDPEDRTCEWTAAKIWMRSDANAKTNINWLYKAIGKYPGPNPYALASEILETGGDIWLSMYPVHVNFTDDGPEWVIKWDHDSFKWILFPPSNRV